MFDRSALIEQCIGAVESATDLPCGDHIAPVEGGWSGGTAGAGTFTGYTVLVTSASQTTPSSLRAKCWDVTFNFQMRTFGANRVQADLLAAAVRSALHGAVFVLDGYSAGTVSCSTIGACDRMDDTDPKLWRCVDSFTSYCSALRA